MVLISNLRRNARDSNVLEMGRNQKVYSPDFMTKQVVSTLDIVKAKSALLVALSPHLIGIVPAAFLVFAKDLDAFFRRGLAVKHQKNPLNARLRLELNEDLFTAPLLTDNL
jgi:hypothetical protein